MSDTAKDVTRYLANMSDELNSVALYSAMSEAEKDPKIAEVYRRLAKTEQAHADTWAGKAREAGASVPEFRPALRTRILAWVARRFGVGTVLPALSAREVNGSNGYSNQPDAVGMVCTERAHAVLLQQITRGTHEGMEGASVAQLEGRHRTAGGNALRAAVLGASDGLLSNFNLVMGVAGAALSGATILLTGFAGMLAGAISMALGEWISVQSSRELYTKQINTEAEEILSNPEEEIEELVLIYQSRGLDESVARTLAKRIMSNPATAVETLARDELGIDSKELGGSAWEAAIASFFLFAAGAVLPVLPYLFLSGAAAIAASACLSALGLFATGAAITLFTGRSVWYSGLRQVLFGLVAAAIVFTIGHLVGASLGG